MFNFLKNIENFSGTKKYEFCLQTLIFPHKTRSARFLSSRSVHKTRLIIELRSYNQLKLCLRIGFWREGNGKERLMENSCLGVLKILV